MPSTCLPQLLLAYFEDTGWYEVNYGAANCSYAKQTYGFKQGCPFALDRCVGTNGAGVATDPEGYFCMGEDDLGCTPSLRGNGYCGGFLDSSSYNYNGYVGWLETADNCPFP